MHCSQRKLNKKTVTLLGVGLASVAIVGWLFSPILFPEADGINVEFLDYAQGGAIGEIAVINRNRHTVFYQVAVEVRTGNSWPTYPVGTLLPHNASQEEKINALSTNIILVTVPAKDLPWRISVFHRKELTNHDRIAATIRVWLYRLRLQKLADSLPLEIPSQLDYSQEIPARKRLGSHF